MPPVASPADRALRLSRRAVVLGSVGVLVAAAAMATLGFTAPHVEPAPTHPPASGVTQPAR